MDAKWCFPSSNGGEKRGLNDSGIETFNDNPIKSLAREICQNSLDAVLINQTAIVEFNTFSLDANNYPDRDGFLNVLNQCYEISKNNKNIKTPTFFKNAINKLSASKITMLRISDFNTTGLKGTDWDNLVNSSGSSEKSESKGGSFGIGKNAPFACSDFRTVFYSSFDTDENEKSKGVSKLISFKLGTNEDGTENLSQGTGYYGVDKTYNILEMEKMISLDKGFVRNTSGTDIFISAFKTTGEEDFKKNIIAEVLDGFLIAIWQEKLEIRVNEYIINKESLNGVISTYNKSLSENTKQCFDLLSSEKTKWFELPIKLSGTMPLGMIIFGCENRINGTNKVSMVRSSGMKILDKTGLCPSLRFIGLALVEGDNLNNFLRGLENPSHNKWEPQRSHEPSVAKDVLRDIYNSITEKLNEVFSNMFDDQIDIDGAGDYLPDEVDEKKSNKEEKLKNNETLNKLISVDVKVIEKPRSVANLETDEIGNDIESTTEAEGNVNDGSGFDGFDHDGKKPHGEGEREKEDVGMLPDDTLNGEQIITVKARDIRIICINKEEQTYRLIFTPTATSPKGHIALYKLAEQNEKMPVQILEVLTKDLESSKNKIGYFNFVSETPIKVDFKIIGDEYSTMEVKLYAYKG